MHDVGRPMEEEEEEEKGFLCAAAVSVDRGASFAFVAPRRAAKKTVAMRGHLV